MRPLVCGLAITFALCASTAFAQVTSPHTPTGEWRFELVPYFWAPGVDGHMEVLNQTADLDAPLWNILDHLHVAAMGMADAHRDQFVALADAVYADVRGQQITVGPLFPNVNPQQKLFIFTPEAGYRITNNDDASIDIVGGVRFWQTRTELQFQAGVLPAFDFQDSRGWVDVIGGVRARKTLPNHWYLNAYGDLGAGGSDFTFQLLGTAGIDLHQRYAVTLGYRYLSVDYEKTTFLLHTALKGPMVGFAFKF